MAPAIVRLDLSLRHVTADRTHVLAVFLTSSSSLLYAPLPVHTLSEYENLIAGRA
jgi:hypothetical protein